MESDLGRPRPTAFNMPSSRAVGTQFPCCFEMARAASVRGGPYLCGPVVHLLLDHEPLGEDLITGGNVDQVKAAGKFVPEIDGRFHKTILNCDRSGSYPFAGHVVDVQVYGVIKIGLACTPSVV